MRFPPWASFYFRSTYAELPDADLPNLPRELNPYERFWIRFIFADLKGIAFLLGGILVGLAFAGISYALGWKVIFA